MLFSRAVDHNAAVLMDRITRTARPSVCPYRSPTQKGVYTYTVSPKKCAKLFCQDFVKFQTTLLTFGTHIGLAQRTDLCHVHLSYLTLPNSR